MLKSKDKNTKWLGVALLGGCILFYLAFYLIDGVQICKDSAGYIAMDLSREPLYPAFLALIRGLFGVDYYLSVVVILQCVLAGYAMWKLGDMVYQYSTSKWILPGLTLLFQMAVALICRFIAERRAIYANEIATEGLTFALYTLFIVQLFVYLKKEKWYYLLEVLILATMLVSIRKQMLIVYAILFAVFLMRFFYRKYSWKKFLFFLVLITMSLLATKGIDKLYNFALRGEFISHTRDSSFFLVTALYVAEDEDAELFEDPETKLLFQEAMDEVKKQELGFDFAQNDWKSRSIHYGNSYDAIGYGIAYPIISEHVMQNHPSGEVAEARKFDYFGNDLTKTLVPANIEKMVNVIASNAIMGFVNTVANVKHYLSFYSLVVYLLFIGMLGYLLGKKIEGNALLMGEITCYAILANVACVALTIFSQPRYMIYNMPLFYLAFVWMGWEIYQKIKEKQNG